MAGLTLRDYQEECVQAHFDFFDRNAEGNPLFVIPTGGGKSLVIAEFVRRSMRLWPRSRFLVLTHVKELIRQNYEEFVGHWGSSLAPAGIYSAGLKRRDLRDPVLFAGIQSVHKRAQLLGAFDLVLVDEAHLIPKDGEGRYRQFLGDLRRINPAVRVCGYTATHYRLDGGYLHRGAGDRIFTHVAYEVRVEQLVAAGHLVPLVAKLPEHVIDVSGCRTEQGDYKLNDLEAAATEGDCVELAVGEVVRVAAERGRRHWLFFCTTVKHAEDVLAQLGARGVAARAVFGFTRPQERDEAVGAFKAGELQALVTVGVLTTGFNAPRCDLMAVMRPTQSAALYVQMMGRGMRTFPGKADCLVLDYGGNVARHGPINAVKPRAERGEAGPPPTKCCPACWSILPLGTSTCPDCGHEWPPAQVAVEHAHVAATLAPYDPDAGRPRVLAVGSVYYRRHEKADRPPSLRVDYLCGMQTFSEWVCLEHPGFAGRKAVRWWAEHGGVVPAPQSVDEALARVVELRDPAAVEVVDDGEFVRVHRCLFGQQGAASG